MAKNTAMTRNSQVVVAITVASGTKSGDVLAIGAGGLMGYALTDRYVASTDDGTKAMPQGLADGQASVELQGVSRVINEPVTGSPTAGAAVYRTAAGAYTATATGNTFVGWFVPNVGIALAPSAAPAA